MGDKDRDIQKVKELIDLMKENDLLELEIAEGQSKIHIKRPGAPGPIHIPMPAIMAASVPAGGPVSEQTAMTGATGKEGGLVEIKSPIVGTFYAAPSPDAEPYVAPGTAVDTETVVCVIDAMKVMNEIKAETTGTIVQICCKDGQSVEYGQTLFKVRP